MKNLVKAQWMRGFFAWQCARWAWEVFGRGLVPTLLIALPDLTGPRAPEVTATVTLDDETFKALLLRIGREWVRQIEAFEAEQDQ